MSLMPSLHQTLEISYEQTEQTDLEQTIQQIEHYPTVTLRQKTNHRPLRNAEVMSPNFQFGQSPHARVQTSQGPSRNMRAVISEQTPLQPVQKQYQFSINSGCYQQTNSPDDPNSGFNSGLNLNQNTARTHLSNLVIPVYHNGGQMMENTFAPSQRSYPMHWERIRSMSASNLASGSDPTSNFKQMTILSGCGSDRAGTLTNTLGDRSIGRYAKDHPTTIIEEASHIERSQMNNFGTTRPSNQETQYFPVENLIMPDDNRESNLANQSQQQFQNGQQFFLQHAPDQSISHSTLSIAQNQSTTNIIRSELMVCRKQVSDLRAMNLFLKKEKLKAEHERNLFDIRNKQLETLLQRLSQGGQLTNDSQDHSGHYRSRSLGILPEENDQSQVQEAQSVIEQLEHQIAQDREVTLLYLLQLTTVETQKEVHTICKEMAQGLGGKTLNQIRNELKSQLKQKYTKRIHELRKENDVQRRENRNCEAKIEQAHTSIKQLIGEKETMGVEIKNFEKQQLSAQQSASQSIIMRTNESFLHVQHEKILEERNLLNIQNQQFRKIIKGQTSVINQLHKAFASESSYHQYRRSTPLMNVSESETTIDDSLLQNEPLICEQINARYDNYLQQKERILQTNPEKSGPIVQMENLNKKHGSKENKENTRRQQCDHHAQQSRSRSKDLLKMRMAGH